LTITVCDLYRIVTFITSMSPLFSTRGKPAGQKSDRATRST